MVTCDEGWFENRDHGSVTVTIPILCTVSWSAHTHTHTLQGLAEGGLLPA